MDEERRTEHQERFRARVEEWEVRLDELKAKARGAESELRAKLQSIDSAGLRERLDDTLSRLRELREASEEGWEEVKAGAEKLWADVREAWERSAEGDSESAEARPGPVESAEAGEGASVDGGAEADTADSSAPL